VKTTRNDNPARVRGAAVLGAVLAAALIAGCGSSSSSSSIGVGKENPHALAEVEKLEREESSSTTSTTSTTASSSTASSETVKTPTSGPLSKEPKVTPPSGPPPEELETKELVKGKGAEAKVGDSVTVNYVGVLYKNGKVFNSSWESGAPASFTISKGSVIEGWVNGIPGMRVGGRRELIIPADEAYGKEGRPPTIPANSALVFVVDLLAV
jgi:FKBP-type peptidyl-prolyl cis-trans isomerase